MSLRKIIHAVALTLLLAAVCFGGQDKGVATTTGGIKGKVKVDDSSTPEGVIVIARRGEREVKRAETDRKGGFVIEGLEPGLYGLTFRKPGLSVGTLKKEVEVRAGKTRTVDGLFLPIDTGSLAYIRGSVFTDAGLIVRGARVELARVEANGSTKKIDGRISNESGIFVFRLMPERALYRLTIKADGMETKTQDVEVEGASRTNVAVTLQRAAK